MSKKSPPSLLKVAIARRLRAVQAERGMTQAAMSEWLKVGRSAWSNWVSEASPEMPSEEAMIAMCDQLASWNLTMDWIYRGRSDRLAVDAAIRLTARVAGLDPDTAGVEVLALAGSGSPVPAVAIEHSAA